MQELDPFFFNEMMTHPALFAHPKPQKVTIIGNHYGILQEVLKHLSIQAVYCVSQKHSMINDPRITYQLELPKENQDVIILTQTSSNANSELYHLLNADGILVQTCPNPLVEPSKLKTTYQSLKQLGFNDWQIVNFPQAGSPLNWVAIMMSTKCPLFKRIREKDIFNKTFSTLYYNYEIHRAALALPEFARVELEN